MPSKEALDRMVKVIMAHQTYGERKKQLTDKDQMDRIRKELREAQRIREMQNSSSGKGLQESEEKSEESVRPLLGINELQ